MAMSDLERQVRERPDDDAPRLAYADAIEADDPERAEFIRVQLRLHSLPDWHPARIDTQRRNNQLISRNWQRWTSHLPTGVTWIAERGFPDVVRFDSHTAFARHYRAALAAGPRRVHLSGWRDPARLGTLPALAEIRELRITSMGAPNVLASPHLGRLTRLEVEGAGPTDILLTAIAGRAELAGLRHLTVGGYHTQQAAFTPAGLAALAGALSSLETLVLRRTALDDALARALLGTAVLPRLRRLDLAYNRITAEGLRALGDGSRFPALRVLLLQDNRVGDGGAAALASAARLGRLSELTLDNNRVGAAGVEALAAAAHLGDLEWLSLATNVLDDEAGVALAESPNVRSLMGLNVCKNLIDERGMLALGRSRTLGRLTYLLADSNPARAVLRTAVVERFTNHAPPLKEAPPLPPPAPAVDVAPVGPADEDGLVRMLVSDPDDEPTKLIYADWLEDHGAADLSELLRLSCEARTLTNDDRSKALRDRLSAAIIADFPRYARQVTFVHGLPVVWVQLRGVLTKAFDSAAEGWLKRHHVHGLHVSGSSYDWNRLAGVSAFAHLRSLSFTRMQFGDAGAAGLAGSPHLEGLVHLDLEGNDVTEAGLRTLFAPGKLPRLCSLNLSYNRAGVDGLRAVAEGAALARLEMRYTQPTSAGVAVLAGCARMSELVALDLTGCWLDDAALEALARSPHLVRLRELTLVRNRFTGHGLDALAGSALMPRLRRLVLDYVQADGAALRRLGRALPAACRLQLSRYLVAAEVQAELTEMLGERMRWI
jgi:uncharacterized protein (TIGR02996 family)